jgi:Steigviridae/Suoliviridae L,D-carboxypeptidase/transpeptidase
MQLTLQRLTDNDECIIGALYVDGATQCFTLELPLLFQGQQNVPCKTCIPSGTYEVDRLYSPHFQKMMPHVVNVPGRTEVEIHVGNAAKDILGCIVVGETRISDVMIGDSVAAFADLEAKLANAWANTEQIWLTIKDIQFLKSITGTQSA